MEYFKDMNPLLNIVLPNILVSNDNILNYRNSYYYERDKNKFLDFFR